ncbi:MAG TPA: hypothetical protein VLH59_10700, partial [Ignavibacteriaceae bacterium]|nr:hypothetical protein [Ignavibacteriaceae bacterium]
MKTTVLKKEILFWFFLIFLISYSGTFSQNVGSAAYIKVNDIYLPFNREGVIADVNIPPFGSGGHFDGEGVLYSGGFFLSGIRDSVWTNGVMPNVFVQDYQSGTVNINPEDPRSAIYKLRSDDPAFGQSWQDWIDAVALGADFYDGDGDGIYNPVDLNGNNQWDPDEDKPDILGDETYWCSYSDGVPIEERRWAGEPLGIEIKQTIFAFETDQLPLANTIFIRYKIVNTGTVVSKLDDIIFGHAYDADIGNIVNNLGGTDIGRNAHYCYGDSTCFFPGMTPLTFLVDFLAGPVSYVPGVSFHDYNGNGTFENGIDFPYDTAYTFSGPLGVQVYIGATNLKMKAGVTYADGDVGQGEPWNPVEARNYLNGLQRRGAEADPCTYPYGEVRGGIDCHTINPYYWYSGDPVANVGWLNKYSTENHAMLSLKSFTLETDQVKDVMIAYIIGTDSDALNSVNAAKELSDDIQELYENNFGYPIVLSADEPVAELNNFKLEQNYPNPFNPSTKIKFTIPNVETRHASSL